MKKKITIRLLSTFLCITMFWTQGAEIVEFLTSGGVVNVLGVTTDDLSNKKNQAEEKQREIQRLNEDIKKYKDEAATTQDYIKKLDEDMAELDGQIYELNGQIEELEEEIADSEVKLEAAQKDAQNQYEMMKLRIQFMYEHNEESYFALIIASNSIGEALNKAEYVSKISDYDREMLERYQATIKLIEDTKKKLEEDKAELEENKKLVEIQKDEVAYLVAEKQAEMEKLSQQIEEASAAQDQANAEYSQIENEIDNIEAELERQRIEEERRRKEEEERQRQAAAAQANQSSSSYQAPVTGSGRFIWPTTSKRITSNYGDIDYGIRGNQAHKGIDIGGSTPGVSGDPIYAADSGRVVISGWNWSGGNWIWIDHGNGLYSIYMHCSKLLVSAGTNVSQGQVIGLMGTTGESTGVHLHFGVRLNGNYVNPWNYLQ